MASTPLSEAFARFGDSLRAAKKSPHTVDAYRRDLEAIAELLVDPLNKAVGEIVLGDVNVTALRHAFAVRADTSAAATVARTQSAWTRFYKFARSEGLTDVSPMDEIEKPRTGTSRPKSIDTPDLAVRLLETAASPPPANTSTRWPTRDTAIIAVLISTGIRLAELVGLNTSSVTGQAGELQLDVTGKGGKYRAIPVLDPVAQTIETYLAERRVRFPNHRLDNRTTPLFVHPASGERVTARQIQYLIDRIYREAGMRGQVPTGALVHALRHTFAMDLLDHGASVIEVQTILGHESLATTRRYLTARPHHLRDAITSTSSSTALKRTTNPR